MSDSSVLMSETLIDKVDMSQFYNLMPDSSQFDCILNFEKAIFNLNLSSFKKTIQGYELQFLCSSDIVEHLISNEKIENIQISRNDREVLLLEGQKYDKVEFEINYIQDISSQVKITLNN